MDKDIVDNSLPDVWATEDTIFEICMEHIEEFPEYITHFDDIEGKYNEKYLSPAYRNLRLDFVRLRKNGTLAHIEHHYVVTSHSLSRNFEYVTTLHAASGMLVYPFIFNTGKIPKSRIECAAPTSFYNPVWVNTQEIEASEKINNVRYKLLKQEPITVFEVIELIWMPKIRSDDSIDDIIMELIELYNNLIIDEKYLPIIRKCLILWAGKYVSDVEKVKKVTGGLKLSTMETEDMCALIRSARIEGALLRSQQKGRREGRKEGLEEGCDRMEFKFISKLLENHTPDEISEDFDVPLEKVLKIKNDNY